MLQSRLLLSAALLLLSSLLWSQSATKLTPEQERLKAQMIKNAEAQIKKLSKDFAIPINEMMLPSTTVQLPKPHPQQSMLLPKQPLSVTELSQRLDKFSVNLKTKLEASALKELEHFINQFENDSIKPLILESTALQVYLNRNLSAALLLQMAAAKANQYKNPSHLINLSGYLNTAGLSHASLVVMDCLNKENKEAVDTSAVAQNNYGHALLGVGKIEEAKKRYQQCLALDSLQPEALSSSAMICWQAGQLNDAINYFKKALCVRYSATDMVCVKKIAQQQGKEVIDVINLYDVFKTKSQYYGEEPQKIYIETGLERLVGQMPPTPQTLQEALQLKQAYAEFNTLVQQEMFRFQQLSMFTAAESEQEGQKEKSFAQNARWQEVEDAFEHLDKQYDGKLNLMTTKDFEYIGQLSEKHSKEKREIENQCPKAPVMVGLDQDWLAVQKAYDQKCCEKVTPYVDQFIMTKNQLYQLRYKETMKNWREYLNAVATLYSKDPTLGRQKHLNGIISNFLNTVNFYAGLLGGNHEPLSYCHANFSKEKTDSLIALAEASLKCRHPKIKANLGVVTGSMENCDKIAVEFDWGLNLKLERQLKAGKSTIFVGAKGKIDKFSKGMVKAGWAAGAVFAVDDNGLTDIGIKGEIGAGVSKTILGTDKKGFTIAPEVKLEGTIMFTSGFEGKLNIPLIDPIKF